MRKQYHFWPGELGLDAGDVDRLIELSSNLPVEEVALEDLFENSQAVARRAITAIWDRAN